MRECEREGPECQHVCTVNGGSAVANRGSLTPPSTSSLSDVSPRGHAYDVSAGPDRTAKVSAGRSRTRL